MKETETIQKIINEYQIKFNLNDFDIDFFQEAVEDPTCKRDACSETYPEKLFAAIFFYVDAMKDLDESKELIKHEMLHILLDRLLFKYVDRSKWQEMKRDEEKIVKILEKLIK